MLDRNLGNLDKINEEIQEEIRDGTPETQEKFLKTLKDCLRIEKSAKESLKNPFKKSRNNFKNNP